MDHPMRRFPAPWTVEKIAGRLIVEPFSLVAHLCKACPLEMRNITAEWRMNAPDTPMQLRAPS